MPPMFQYDRSSYAAALPTPDAGIGTGGCACSTEVGSTPRTNAFDGPMLWMTSKRNRITDLVPLPLRNSIASAALRKLADITCHMSSHHTRYVCILRPKVAPTTVKFGRDWQDHHCFFTHYIECMMFGSGHRHQPIHEPCMSAVDQDEVISRTRLRPWVHCASSLFLNVCRSFSDVI